jgi:hypothetical protein
VLHALVLAADALVVLHGPKDLRAEETVSLGLEGSVVDGLRLLHLAVRPLRIFSGLASEIRIAGRMKAVLDVSKKEKNTLNGFSSFL